MKRTRILCLLALGMAFFTPSCSFKLYEKMADWEKRQSDKMWDAVMKN